MSLRSPPKQLGERQLAGDVVRVGRDDVDAAVEVDGADLHRLRVDVRVGRAVGARATFTAPSPFRSVPSVRCSARNSSCPLTDARSTVPLGQSTLESVTSAPTRRARCRPAVSLGRAAVGDEVEAVFSSTPKPKLRPNGERDLRREARLQAERRDAEVEAIVGSGDRLRDAELHVELDLLRVEDVHRRAAGVAERAESWRLLFIRTTWMSLRPSTSSRRPSNVSQQLDAARAEDAEELVLDQADEAVEAERCSGAAGSRAAGAGSSGCRRSPG